MDEPELLRFAETMAFAVRPGDVIALHGDLGAGKTTFARALIAALSAGATEEVPSPTFTLVQSYETPRMPVWHFDLYRLSDASELGELGFDHAQTRGLVLVEWPERAGGFLPDSRLEVALEDRGEVASGDPPASLRTLRLTGYGDWAARLGRLVAMRQLARQARFDGGGARFSYIQGDASVRRYARLRRSDGATAVLMDWPPQPDGPPIRDGKPYSRLAHLAENVRPFVAIAGALRGFGLSAPDVLAHDLERGLLVIEDLGDVVFDRALTNGHSQAELWRTAVDALVALRARPVPEQLTLPDGSVYRLPLFDHGAMQIEIELLLDWYWPAVHGKPPGPTERQEFIALWSGVFDRLLALPRGWVLRDYHSPNLLWLPSRKGIARVGIIDFQDAVRGPAAFDLVSLVQDARVDVPPSLQTELFEHYCTAVAGAEPAFDRSEFGFAYAALGMQRNTKILGIFARLAKRDGKPGYLRHMPRLWRYIAANLEHPDLYAVRAWYDAHFPAENRVRALESV